MLDWFERQTERATRRLQFLIASRLHPELNRIEREDDRMWALWFAGADPPAWQRYLFAVMVLLVGPITVTVLVFAVAELLSLRWRGIWMLLFVGGWLSGFAVTAVLAELIRDRTIRPRYFTAMRIFGHDVCQRCGYDMAGHAGDPWAVRLCPECGGTVAPLEGPRRRSQPGGGPAGPSAAPPPAS